MDRIFATASAPRAVALGVAVLLTLGGLGAGSGPSPARAEDDDFSFDLSGEDEKEKKKKKKKKAKSKNEQQQAEQAAGGDEGGFGFEALDVSVKSAEKEAMEKALDLMKNEDYAEAAVAFWDIYNNPRAKQYFQGAEYQLAKALYRMRMYHSALRRFGLILEKGPKHKYFKTSLEWLFFISHKVEDQKRVLDYIARYSDVEFPKKYRDEFLFLLAKYFYFRALDLEAGRGPGPKKAAAAAADSAPAEEGGLGFDLGGGEEEDAGGFGLDLSGGDQGAAGEEEAVGDGGFGLELDVEKKVGPSALPTDVVGMLSKSRALILQIDEKSKWYPRGKYLEGIIFYKEENYQEAVESFKQVVRILHPDKGEFRDDRLREMAFFQLARTHYGHKQFNYALFYYDRIERDSVNWLESLFESAWAWFRLGRYQKALGNLITLDSPFFREEYFPEGLVLKAVTYYENCRYPESNQIVREFRRRFEPLFEKLEKLTEKELAPESYYKKLLAIQKAPPSGESGRLLRRILKVALADKDLALLNESVLELEKEMRRIRRKTAGGFANSKVAQRLMDMLGKQRTELITQAGLLTKARLEQERDFLAGLISQALRIKLENDNAELEMLKRQKAGETNLGPTLLSYDFSPATDDEKLYWPYEGEYWRDELGTYEYTLTWGCRKQVD
jgi:outer membrane protein assembly factor BamD (BamD/ComL family)